MVLPANAPRPRPRVACMGELLIDFVALESGVAVGQASGFQKAPGGAPANVAVGVARLGGQAAFLGQVGDDPFGHFLAGVLAADGVDVAGLRFSGAARTALAFVSLAAGGERSFVFYRHPSADMLMTPDDLHLPAIDGADAYHFGSITLIDEPVRAATLRGAEHARARGVLVSCDPNLRLALWPGADAARAGMRLGIAAADVVKISDEELAFLTGGDDPRALFGPHTQLVVVTHGAGGSTAVPRDGAPVTVPGFAVTPVDTTGAGDGFVAGLLLGLLGRGGVAASGPALADVLRAANAVGALTTTARGAIPALPSAAAVARLLHGGDAPHDVHALNDQG